jgi:hypothetical protein
MNQYYDSEKVDCYFKRQMKEECRQNHECGENLVCDVKVAPSPISEQRKLYCLKDHGIQCKANDECVNFLPCNNGLCGCRVSMLKVNLNTLR